MPFTLRPLTEPDARVYERAGFIRVDMVHVTTPQGPRDFVEMRRPA